MKDNLKTTIIAITIFSAMLVFSAVVGYAKHSPSDPVGECRARFSMGDVVRKSSGEQGVVIGRAWDRDHWLYDVRFSINHDPEKVSDPELEEGRP